MTVVREFHIASGQAVADYPTVPDPATVRLRIRLVKEEYKEVMEHLDWLLHHQDARLPEKLDHLRDLLGELCDLRYVVEGTAVSLGLPIDEAYEAIHEANMSKRWPGEAFMRKDEGGKVLKGPDYRKADLRRFVDIRDGEAENA